MNGSRHMQMIDLLTEVLFISRRLHSNYLHMKTANYVCVTEEIGVKCVCCYCQKIPHGPLNSNKEEYTNLPLILKTLCHSFPYPMSCSVYNVTVKHRLRKGNIAVKYGNLWNLTLSAASKWIREYYCINYPSNGYSCFQSWTLRRPKISLL